MTKKIMPMISVLARFIPLAMAFAARDDVRYFLNGILLQRHSEKGVIIVATDGHSMICIYDSEGIMEGDQDEWIVNFDSKVLTKCRGKRATTIIFEPSEDSATKPNLLVINTDDGQHSEHLFDVIDGTFPDWRRVLGKSVEYKKSNEFAMFNPLFFERFKLLDIAIPSRGDTGLQLIDIYANVDPSKPFMVKTSSPNIFGIVAPAARARDQKANSDLPSWV